MESKRYNYSDLRKTLSTKARRFKTSFGYKMSLNIDDWDFIFELLEETFADLMNEGYKVHTPLGTFELKETKEKRIISVLDKKEIIKPKGKKLTYQASGSFKERLNVK